MKCYPFYLKIARSARNFSGGGEGWCRQKLLRNFSASPPIGGRCLQKSLRDFVRLAPRVPKIARCLTFMNGGDVCGISLRGLAAFISGKERVRDSVLILLREKFDFAVFLLNASDQLFGAF